MNKIEHPLCTQCHSTMLTTKNYLDFQILDRGSVVAEWKGAEKANRALPEDKVCLREDGTVEILERAPKKPLVGVLQLTSKYMYGMTSHGVPMYCCQPMNKGYPSFRVACKERDRSQNLLVSFQFESWEADSELPRGSLLKILGVVEDPAAEAEALAILSCPWSAPRPESGVPLINGDRTLLSTGTFNIDPVGCKDIDDVITLEKLTDDSVRLWITIADVSEMLDPSRKEFVAAEKIGATSYQGGFAIRPMLHKDLSEKAFSLLPGETRYGLALRIDWNKGKGFIGKPMFEPVLVINQISYTYENILMAEQWILDTLSSVASDMAGRKITDSHEWVEQLMLFYNRQAALILREVGGGLLRVHDQPMLEKQAVLKTIDPGLQHLAYQAAAYAPVTTTKTHYGLSLESYCHCTSPIRRFADIINQQIIKNWLEKKSFAYSDERFELLTDWLNRRQRQIAAAERDYILLKAIQISPQNSVEATFLWREGEKNVYYVSSWQTTIRVQEKSLERTAGGKYTVQYYCDRTKASWKERMIYRVTG